MGNSGCSIGPHEEEISKAQEWKPGRRLVRRLYQESDVVHSGLYSVTLNAGNVTAQAFEI